MALLLPELALGRADPSDALDGRLREALDLWPGHRSLVQTRHREDVAAIEVRFFCSCQIMVVRDLSYQQVQAPGEVGRVLDELIAQMLDEHRPSLETLTSWGWFNPETT